MRPSYISFTAKFAAMYFLIMIVIFCEVNASCKNYSTITIHRQKWDEEEITIQAVDGTITNQKKKSHVEEVIKLKGDDYYDLEDEIKNSTCYSTPTTNAVAPSSTLVPITSTPNMGTTASTMPPTTVTTAAPPTSMMTTITSAYFGHTYDPNFPDDRNNHEDHANHEVRVLKPRKTTNKRTRATRSTASMLRG